MPVKPDQLARALNIGLIPSTGIQDTEPESRPLPEGFKMPAFKPGGIPSDQDAHIYENFAHLDEDNSEGFRIGYHDPEFYQAANQGGWELFGNGLAQGLSQITLGTVEAAVAMNPWQAAMSFITKEEDFNNIALEWIRETMDTLNKETRIFDTPDLLDFSLDDIYDPRFVAKNIGNVLTSLSLLLPSYGVGRGIGALSTKIMKRLTQGAALSRKSKKIIDGVSGAAMGFASRMSESGLEAAEVYDQMIKSGYTKAQAEAAAAEAYNNNFKYGIALDVIQGYALTRMFNFNKFKYSDRNTPQKKSAWRKAADYSGMAVTEAGEEGMQFVISEEALRKFDDTYKGFSFGARLRDHITDDKFWESAYLGAIGGVLITAGGKSLSTLADKWTAYKSGEESGRDKAEKMAKEAISSSLGDHKASKKYRDAVFFNLVSRFIEAGNISAVERQLKVSIEEREAKEDKTEHDERTIEYLKHKLEELPILADIFDRNFANTRLNKKYTTENIVTGQIETIDLAAIKSQNDYVTMKTKNYIVESEKDLSNLTSRLQEEGVENIEAYIASATLELMNDKDSIVDLKMSKKERDRIIKEAKEKIPEDYKKEESPIHNEVLISLGHFISDREQFRQAKERAPLFFSEEGKRQVANEWRESIASRGKDKLRWNKANIHEGAYIKDKDNYWVIKKTDKKDKDGNPLYQKYKAVVDSKEIRDEIRKDPNTLLKMDIDENVKSGKPMTLDEMAGTIINGQQLIYDTQLVTKEKYNAIKEKRNNLIHGTYEMKLELSEDGQWEYSKKLDENGNQIKKSKGILDLERIVSDLSREISAWESRNNRSISSLKEELNKEKEKVTAYWDNRKKELKSDIAKEADPKVKVRRQKAIAEGLKELDKRKKEKLLETERKEKYNTVAINNALNKNLQELNAKRSILESLTNMRGIANYTFEGKEFKSRQALANYILNQSGHSDQNMQTRYPGTATGFSQNQFVIDPNTEMGIRFIGQKKMTGPVVLKKLNNDQVNYIINHGSTMNYEFETLKGYTQEKLDQHDKTRKVLINRIKDIRTRLVTQRKKIEEAIGMQYRGLTDFENQLNSLTRKLNKKTRLTKRDKEVLSRIKDNITNARNNIENLRKDQKVIDEKLAQYDNQLGTINVDYVPRFRQIYKDIKLVVDQVDGEISSLENNQKSLERSLRSLAVKLFDITGTKIDRRKNDLDSVLNKMSEDLFAFQAAEDYKKVLKTYQDNKEKLKKLKEKQRVLKERYTNISKEWKSLAATVASALEPKGKDQGSTLEGDPDTTNQSWEGTKRHPRNLWGTYSRQFLGDNELNSEERDRTWGTFLQNVNLFDAKVGFRLVSLVDNSGNLNEWVNLLSDEELNILRQKDELKSAIMLVAVNKDNPSEFYTNSSGLGNLEYADKNTILSEKSGIATFFTKPRYTTEANTIRVYNPNSKIPQDKFEEGLINRTKEFEKWRNNLLTDLKGGTQLYTWSTAKSTGIRVREDNTTNKDSELKQRTLESVFEYLSDPSDIWRKNSTKVATKEQITIGSVGSPAYKGMVYLHDSNTGNVVKLDTVLLSNLGKDINSDGTINPNSTGDNSILDSVVQAIYEAGVNKRLNIKLGSSGVSAKALLEKYTYFSKNGRIRPIFDNTGFTGSFEIIEIINGQKETVTIDVFNSLEDDVDAKVFNNRSLKDILGRVHVQISSKLMNTPDSKASEFIAPVYVDGEWHVTKYKTYKEFVFGTAQNAIKSKWEATNLVKTPLVRAAMQPFSKNTGKPSLGNIYPFLVNDSSQHPMLYTMEELVKAAKAKKVPKKEKGEKLSEIPLEENITTVLEKVLEVNTGKWTIQIISNKSGKTTDFISVEAKKSSYKIQLLQNGKSLEPSEISKILLNVGEQGDGFRFKAVKDKIKSKPKFSQKDIADNKKKASVNTLPKESPFGGKENKKPPSSDFIGFKNLKRPATKTEYKREDFREAEKWFKDRFPQVPFSIVDGLIANSAWGQVSKAGLVLSNLAEEGTVYHEAFHVTSQFFLSSKEKVGLYNEFVSRNKGKEMTSLTGETYIIDETLSYDIIEEFLAEDYREYKLTGKMPYPRKQKNFFQKIADFFKWMFNLSTPEINEIFEKIDQGAYANSSVKNIGEKTFNRPIGDLTEEQSLDVKKFMDLNFFTLLFENDSSLYKLLSPELKQNELNEIYKNIYGAIDSALRNKYNEWLAWAEDNDLSDEQKHIVSMIGYITDNFYDRIVPAHTEWLQKYNVQINSLDIVEELSEDRSNDPDNDIPKQAQFISAKVNANRIIKLLLSGVLKPEFSRHIGLPIAEDFSKLFNFLVNGLANKNTLQEKLDFLQNSDIANKFNKRQIDDILRKINLTALSNTMSAEDMMTITAFNQTFNNHKNIYEIIHFSESDGAPITLFAKDNSSLTDTIRDIWSGNIIDETSNGFSKLVWTKGGVAKYRTKDTELLELMNPDTWGLSVEAERFNNALKFADYIGIRFDNNEALSKLPKESKVEIIEILEWLSKSIKNNKTLIFDRSLKEDGRIKTLIEYAIDTSIDYIENMHFNLEGKPVYSAIRNNFMTYLMHEIESTNSIEELHQKLPHLSLVKNSKWLKELYQGGSFNHKIMEGIKTENEKGLEFSEMSTSDRFFMYYQDTINGKYHMLRAADGSLERVFDFGRSLVTPHDQDIVDNFLNHLEDELNIYLKRSQDFENGIRTIKTTEDVEDINIRHNKELSLGFFDIFAESLKQTLKSDSKKNGADNAILANISQVKKELFSHLNRETKKVERLALDHLVAIPRSDGKYNVEALRIDNTDALLMEESEGNLTAINRETFNNLNRVVAAGFILSGIEQSRLFLGHTQNFNNAEDFFKRMSGPVGPKKMPSVDPSINSWIETNFNRPNEEDPVLNISVSQDIELGARAAYLREWKSYSVDEKGRGRINKTDGQGYITLDAYRELLFRVGDWSPELEKAYEWQKQKGWNKDSITVPKSSPFASIRGEVVTKEDIESKGYKFNALKPQYYGPYVNDTSIAFKKLSVLPLIPSMTQKYDLMEDFRKKLEKEKIDIHVFESASKADFHIGKNLQRVTNAQGKIAKKSLLQSKLYFKYMGIQVDQGFSYKTKNTSGTQFGKHKWSSIFEKGEIKEEFKDLEQDFNNYNSLNDSRLNLGKEQLTRKLGLTLSMKRNPETGKFEEVYHISDTKRLLDNLRYELIQRDLADNVIDSLEYLTIIGVEASINKDKIENILMSLANNSIISRKRSGAPLVQASQMFFNTSYEYDDGSKVYGDDLKFYGLINKETGEEYNNSDDLTNAELKELIESGNLQVRQMEVYLPWYFRNVPENYLVDNKLKELISFRIPTQGLNSIDSIVVKGFLPPGSPEVVITPSEFVAKTGSDFDIDKLYIYTPNYIIDHKSKSIRYMEYTTDEEKLFNRWVNENRREELEILKEKNLWIQDFNDQLQDLKRDLIQLRIDNKQLMDNLLEEFRNDYSTKGVTPEFKELKDLFNYFDENLEKIKASEEWESLLEKKGTNATLEEYEINVLDRIKFIKQLKRYFSKQYLEFSQNPYDVYKEQKKVRLKRKLEINELKESFREDFNTLSLDEKNGIRAIENKMMDIYKKLITHPKRFMSLVNPVDNPVIQNIAEHIGERTGKMKDYNTWDVFSIETNLEMSEKYLNAKTSIGRAALQQTNHILGTIAGLELNEYLKIGGESVSTNIRLNHNRERDRIILSSNTDINNEYNINDILGYMLNGYVDAVKNPYLFYINAGLESNDVFMFLVRAGVPIEEVAYFMSQPIITDYLDAMSKYKSQHYNLNNFKSNKNIAKEVYIKYQSPDLNEYQIYDRISLGAMKEIIDKKGGKFDRLTREERALQLNILDEFLLLKNIAGEITKMLMATNYDTGSYGKNISHSLIKNHVTNSLIEEGNIIHFNRLVNESHLAPFYNQIKEINKIYNPLFLSLSDPRVKELITQKITDLIAGETFTVNIEKFIEKYIKDFYSYAIHVGENLSKETSLYTGKNSVPRRINKYRNRVADTELGANALLNSFNIHLNNVDPDTGETIDNLSIRMSKDSSELNILTNAWRELHKVNPVLSMDLYRFSIYQSGLQNSPNSFWNIAPHEIHADIIINSLDKISEKENFADFDSQFYLNNWRDDIIVPRIRKQMLKAEIGRGVHNKVVKRTTRTSEGYKTVLYEMRVWDKNSSVPRAPRPNDKWRDVIDSRNTLPQLGSYDFRKKKRMSIQRYSDQDGGFSTFRNEHQITSPPNRENISPEKDNIPFLEEEVVSSAKSTLIPPTTSKKILKSYIESEKNKDARAFHNWILDKVKDIPVEFVTEDWLIDNKYFTKNGNIPSGIYLGNRIIINSNRYRIDNLERRHIVLHELLHAITFDTINSRSDIARRWRRIHFDLVNEFRKRNLDTKINALRDPHELLSSIFTDKKLIDLLSSQPPMYESKSYKNVFEQIINFFKRVLNVPRGSYTLFDNVINDAIQVVEEKFVNPEVIIRAENLPEINVKKHCV